MSYGMEVLGPTGNRLVTMDRMGVLFQSTESIPGSSGTWTFSYPQWAGRTGFAAAFDQGFGDNISTSWSYGSGYPVLTVQRTVNGNNTGSRGNSPIFVFIQ